jgi:hypothetical protein
MFGIGNNSQQSQQNGAMNLSMSGAPVGAGFGQPTGVGLPGFGANGFGQQQQQNPFMGSMMGGAGMNPNMMGQPMAPPSEMEIQMALLKSLVPIDRFIAGQQMGVLIELLGSMVTFSVIEILRNSKFTLSDEGIMELDVSKLPSHLQTVSADNVQAQFTALQGASTQSVQQAEMLQHQIAAMAQQSMMGGALSAAMADEGMMTRMGSGIGSVARGLITGR